jgi:thioredoxin
MRELTSEDFAATVAKGNVIIDFWAPWCGPCRMMAPHFEEASKNAKGIVYAKVDVDAEPALAQQFGIRSIPTLVFLKAGQEVNRTMGALTKAQIEQKAKDAFS